jgi:hypothetical protein
MRMKKFLVVSVLASAALVSCDHVDNPLPEQEVVGDWSLYPLGDSAHYAQNAWPSFGTNSNTQRNILIEDYTGHRCVYCAPAGDTAHTLHELNPSRVYVAAIHAGPTGAGSFQQPLPPEFPLDFTNTDGLDMGIYFGGLPGTAFIANPSGNISRIATGGQIFASSGEWRSRTNAGLATSPKVNLQSAVNYYPSTRGVFLHTEVDVLDQSLNVDDLYAVVYLLEDSLVAPQKMPPPLPTEEDYVHRDIMRDCVQTGWRGKKITEGTLENGKYYFYYIYELPAQYDASNMHFLIYVRNNVTEEIYQVIKQDIE